MSQKQEAVQSISLFYRESSSDKVYHCQVNKKADLYTVDFQYGRCGQTLQTGTKTTSPVDLASATKILDKLVKEKKAKGYCETEGATPYTGSENAGKLSGLQAQLLNFIEEKDVEKYLNDPAWCMEEKKDGTRLMVRKTGSTIEGSNRKGLIIPLAPAIEQALAQTPYGFVIDGEAIGDVYWVFDMLEHQGCEIRKRDVAYRHDLLTTLLNDGDGFPISSAVRLVPLYCTVEVKTAMYQLLKNEKAEGVVFKKILSEYCPGRPNSGGNHVKFKFYSTGTFRVSKLNSEVTEGVTKLPKRSVQIEACVPKTGQLKGCFLTVGNVTIPINQDIPSVGDLVEVRYLYYFPGGSLFQPTCLGVRTDIDQADTVISLKTKQETDEDN